MANPDHGADHASQTQEHLNNTLANLRKAEEYLDHASQITQEQRQGIEARNERRRESIESFAAEKEDETQL